MAHTASRVFEMITLPYSTDFTATVFSHSLYRNNSSNVSSFSHLRFSEKCGDNKAISLQLFQAQSMQMYKV